MGQEPGSTSAERDPDPVISLSRIVDPEGNIIESGSSNFFLNQFCRSAMSQEPELPLQIQKKIVSGYSRTRCRRMKGNGSFRGKKSDL